MKKLLPFLLIFLLVLTACGPKNEPQSSTSADTTATTTGSQALTQTNEFVKTATLPFWTVTDPATGAKIYLLGSIHAAREDLYPLPQAIMDAYNNSDYLVVEANIVTAEQDMALLVRCMEKMVYTNGSKITSYISDELYQEAKKLLIQEGMYNITLDYMMPVMWATTIQNIWVEKSSLRSELGVDRHFLTLAASDGKTIVEVESVEDQYAMLASFSPKLQELFLSSSIQEPEIQVQELEELYNVWLEGDLEKIEALSSEVDESLTEEEQVLVEEYKQKLLYGRNSAMAQRAEAFLKEQKTCFFIVGAAHMAGETGVLAYLTEKGYQITE